MLIKPLLFNSLIKKIVSSTKEKDSKIFFIAKDSYLNLYFENKAEATILFYDRYDLEEPVKVEITFGLLVESLSSIKAPEFKKSDKARTQHVKLSLSKEDLTVAYQVVWNEDKVSDFDIKVPILEEKFNPAPFQSLFREGKTFLVEQERLTRSSLFIGSLSNENLDKSFNGVLFTSENGKLYSLATDGATACRSTIAENSDMETICVSEYSYLTLRKFLSKDIAIQVNGGSLLVTSDNARVAFSTLNHKHAMLNHKIFFDNEDFIEYFSILSTYINVSFNSLVAYSKDLYKQMTVTCTDILTLSTELGNLSGTPAMISHAGTFNINGEMFLSTLLKFKTQHEQVIVYYSKSLNAVKITGPDKLNEVMIKCLD